MKDSDAYVRRPSWRWLALLAALMAWGFDGMEQGVYSIMTRQALKDIVPGVPDMSRQLATLKQQAESMAGEPAAAEATRRRAAEIGDRIDQSIGRFFGWSLAMWLWGAATGGVLFGRLGDRYGRARMLLLAVVTYAGFTGLSALSPHWIYLIAFRFLGALGLGGTWPLCVALVVETWPERFRAVLAGSIGAASNVGFLLAATCSRILLAHNYTWRGVIAVGCIMGLLSLPIIAMVPEPTKWRQSRAKKEKSSLGDLFGRQYLRSTVVGSLLSTVALLGTWGSFLWLATYVDKLAEGTAYAGSAKAVVSQYQSIGQILGGFMGGVLAGWLGNRRSYLLLCIAAWASVFALFGTTNQFDMRATWLAALAGLFVTSFFGWLPKYLPELYPTRIRASGQGFAYNIGRVLAGFGVLAAGELVHLFRGDYQKGAVVMASVYLLGMFIIWFAPDTGGRMTADSADQAASLSEAKS